MLDSFRVQDDLLLPLTSKPPDGFGAGGPKQRRPGCQHRVVGTPSGVDLLPPWAEGSGRRTTGPTGAFWVGFCTKHSPIVLFCLRLWRTNAEVKFWVTAAEGNTLPTLLASGALSPWPIASLTSQPVRKLGSVQVLKYKVESRPSGS